MTTAGEQRSERETWLYDLHWHKKAYLGARWRWWGEHVMDTLTQITGGKLNYNSLDDLRRLHEHHMTALDEAFVCQLALAEPLRQALPVVGSWDEIGPLVGLTPVECSAAVYYDELEVEQDRTNAEIRRIQRMIARQVFKNPLILTLELTQLWRCAQAVAFMLEDVVCDLLVELRANGRPDQVLSEAIGARTAGWVETRIRSVLEVRGGPGDPRRVPRQVLQRVV